MEHLRYRWKWRDIRQFEECYYRPTSNASSVYETNINLTETTADDVVYIGMNAGNNFALIEPHDGTVLGKLVNKVLPDSGYYPSALQVTGNITFANDNSEFNEKQFIVGDGTKNTTVTLTGANTLP